VGAKPQQNEEEGGPKIGEARGKARKEFDDVFNPLEERLKASLDRTKGLTGVAPGVGVAEQAARDAAVAAEKAADDNDYTTANDKLK
jgi:hypothetical protein